MTEPFHIQKKEKKYITMSLCTQVARGYSHVKKRVNDEMSCVFDDFVIFRVFFYFMCLPNSKWIRTKKGCNKVAYVHLSTFVRGGTIDYGELIIHKGVAVKDENHFDMMVFSIVERSLVHEF